jgi:hypothetical protein
MLQSLLELEVLEQIATLQVEQMEATQYFQQLHLPAAVVDHRVEITNRFPATEVRVEVQEELARGLELAEVEQQTKVLQVAKLWAAILIFLHPVVELVQLLPIQHPVENRAEQV